MHSLCVHRDSASSTSLGLRVQEALLPILPGDLTVTVSTTSPTVASTKGSPLAPTSSSGGLGLGAIVGIVAGGVVLVVAVPLVVYLSRPVNKAVKVRPGGLVCCH